MQLPFENRKRIEQALLDVDQAVQNEYGFSMMDTEKRLMKKLNEPTPKAKKQEKTLKILFLDIDGVANCATTNQRHRGYIGIDPEMAFRIGKIQLYTECEVVLSSTWRHMPDGREEVERQICKLFDVTPGRDELLRGDEVNLWLADHPEVTRYAILDDNPWFHPEQPLFKTEWSTGITDEIMDSVIKYLNDDRVEAPKWAGR